MSAGIKHIRQRDSRKTLQRSVLTKKAHLRAQLNKRMANKPPPVTCVRCGGPYSSYGHTCEAAQGPAPSPLDAATCSAFTGYIPEVWEVKKDAIYAAIHAIESGLEYARQCLCDHDAALGRTTHKNSTWAETIESDIRQMENARDLLPVRQPNDPDLRARSDS